MGSVTLRDSIRWLPDPASEPTSTLIITSPQNHFVDIRVKKPEGFTGAWPTQNENLPLDRLDWGMAGLVNTTDTQDGKVIEVKWDHWIDSRSAVEYSDEGVWYPQCNGDVLETGVMLNPDTGKDTDYEEVWKYLDPFPKAMPDQVKAVTLQMEKGTEERGLMVRLGRYCQSLVRRGDKIAGERWEWSEEDGWKKLITIGDEVLPCAKVLVEKLPWTVGDVVQVGDNDTWKVIEMSNN